MDNHASFSTVLNEYVQRSLYTPGQLSTLTGIPKTTIVRWLDLDTDIRKKPRNWGRLLKLAIALHLNKMETNELLQAAGHPSIEALTELAADAEEKKLLAHWNDDGFHQFQESSLPTLPSPPFQAPGRVRYFVGREKAVGWFEDQMAGAQQDQIIGLTGLGGVGKTALAIQIAHNLRERFADGVLWAQLDTTTPAAALRNFAAAYGQAQAVAEAPNLAEKAAVVRQILANKEILIVLDNAEESEQIRHLIPNGKRNTTLITTRNRKLLINLDATRFDVTPLEEKDGLTLLKLAAGQDRVMAEEAAARKVVNLVEGLPLALNVIAGYLAEAHDLKIAEYTDLLEDETKRLEELEDWEDTSKSVEASFLLSYRRLSYAGQKLFAALSIFAGPDFSTEAVAAVADISLVKAKRELGRLHVLSLIETGLGKQEDKLPDRLSNPGRYRLHPLLKIFAREYIDSESAILQQRAATYFANLAGQNRYPDGYPVLDLDWDNTIGAMQWAYEDQSWDILLKGVQGLTQIELGVIGYADARGYWTEARQLLSWGLAGLETVHDSFLEATLLGKLGAFANRQADLATAEKHFQKSWQLLAHLPASAEVRLQRAVLYGLTARLKVDHEAKLDWLEQGLNELAGLEADVASHQMGYLFILQAEILGDMGALEAAIEQTKKGLALLPKSPTSARISGLINLTNFYYWLGDSTDSKECLDEAIKMAEALNDLPHLANLYDLKGTSKAQAGHYDAAIKAHHQALKLYQRLGAMFYECTVRASLGLSYHRLGDAENALAQLATAVDLAEQYQLPEAEGAARINLARYYIDQDQFTEAAQCTAKAHKLCVQQKLIYELPEALSLQAEIALAKKGLNKALSLADESLQAAKMCGYSLAEGISLRVKANVLSAMEQTEQAEQTYRTSETILTEQDRYELARSKLALARHHARHKQTTAAAEKAEEALALFSQLKTKRELAAAQALLAQTTEA